MLPIRALLNLFRNVMKYSNNEQQIELDSTALKTVQTGHTYTNPRQCGYLTHVHSHITQVVAATDSCVTLIGARQLGIAFGLLNGENPRLTAEVSAKQSIKRQLYTTHVGAVGWEPHRSSPKRCTGKADHGFGVCLPLALICLLKTVN